MMNAVELIISVFLSYINDCSLPPPLGYRGARGMYWMAIAEGANLIAFLDSFNPITI